MTAASLSGIISISPARIIPSRTPNPDGTNIASIPIIADMPKTPAQNSISFHPTAGFTDLTSIKNPYPTISQLPINISTTFKICEYFIGISSSFLKILPITFNTALIIFGWIQMKNAAISSIVSQR